MSNIHCPLVFATMAAKNSLTGCWEPPGKLLHTSQKDFTAIHTLVNMNVLNPLFGSCTLGRTRGILHPALGYKEDVEQPEESTQMIRRIDQLSCEERLTELVLVSLEK